MTAVVVAGLIALGAGHPLPELKGQTGPGGFEPVGVGGVITPPARKDPGRPGRWADRATSVAVSRQPGQDLWQLPVRGNYLVSSMFGRRWGVLHPGIDLAVPEGTPIYAANAGIVILSRWNGGYGNNVMLQHDDGVVSVYGHASRLIRTEGSRVAAGDLIAYSGNTGYSTGPHLHFELRRDNQPFDAMPFMRRHGVDLAKRIEVVNGGVLDPLR